MEQKKYVQHISGQGEKWEVAQDLPDTNEYQVHTKSGTRVPYHFLPRSEYRLCEPQEEWWDVTVHCEIGRFGKDQRFPELLFCVDTSTGNNAFYDKYYRVRKIDHLHNGPAFIIERKKAPQRP